MKYTTTVLSLLTLLSTSTAQSLNDVPACAFTRRFCADAGVDLQVTTTASTSEPTETPSSTVPAPSATGTNGTLNPGNSTVGGAPQPANPTPPSPPISGVSGLVAMAKNGGILGVVLVGAVMIL
ncbi:MAG: hypothetical protein Q9209_006223 [Squamulea sp. 1 TL-2023]